MGDPVDGSTTHAVSPKATPGEIQPGSLRHDAPLQIRREHRDPHAGHQPWSRRMWQFLVRNRYPIAFGTFVYVEFLGFPTVTVTAHDKNRVLALRSHFSGNTVHGIEYRPPAAKDQDLRRAGAFSIVDRKMPSMKDLPIAADRAPFSERLRVYAMSYFPNPFYSRLSETGDGRNTLQYNALLYYVQEFTERTSTFLPIDAVTSDGRLAIHVALKLVYRTWKVYVPADNPGHPGVGFMDPKVDYITKEVIEKWVKEATADDIRAAPQRRIHSSVADSLAGMTGDEMRWSVEKSTMEHGRFLMECESAAQAAAEAGEVFDPSTADIKLPATALDKPETLRRIWASQVAKRFGGGFVVEDLMWKFTVTELNVDDDKSLHPELSSSWQF